MLNGPSAAVRRPGRQGSGRLTRSIVQLIVNDVNHPESAVSTPVSEDLARLAELTGGTPSAGRLWTLLWFSDRPLSLEELADRAGLAKSGASITLRRLVDARLARRLPTGTDRRSFYTVSDSPWAVVETWLRTSLVPELEILQRATGLGLAQAGADDNRVLIERFTAWRGFLTEASGIVDRILDEIPKEASPGGGTPR